MTISIAIIMLSSILLLLLSLISWGIHISQTNKFSKKWGWGNYSRFKREFSLIQWEPRRNHWRYSIFDYVTNSEIHESIIRFNGKGMCLDYFSWIIFKYWLYKNRVSITKYEKWN